MANNPYVNKVQLADGTSLIDISDTTAVASDVASGKYFYTATGAKEQGTASGGGSVTITDEPNATGTTCVITTGGSPAPSGDIPLNTELIDFTAITNNTVINSQGQAVAEQWYRVSDYTRIESTMTFTVVGLRWYYIGFYDADKSVTGALMIDNIPGTVLDNTNFKEFVINSSYIPSGSKYCRITSGMNQGGTTLSLIRTA